MRIKQSLIIIIHVSLIRGVVYKWIIMARRAIPRLLSHGFELYIYNIYNIIYFLVSTSRVLVIYVVKEVASFLGGRSINGRGT